VKALIIAAGEGSRLHYPARQEPKPLVPLLGLSLIERVILSAKQAGIRDFVIVTGYLGERIEAKLGSGDRYGVRVEYVENERWREGNGGSVLRAKSLLKDRFILLMSDHIFDHRIVRDLAAYETDSCVVLATDPREPAVGDTRVLEEGGKIIDIGKDIAEANCVDTGIFLCSARLFTYIEEAAREGKTELADSIGKAAVHGDAETFDIGESGGYSSKMRKEVMAWWVDVDTEEDLRRARELVVEDASKNPSDLLACYVHKPIENRLVGWISRYSVTPNQLSVVVNVLAYLATALFFVGQLLPGSILTFAVGIADGLDGKLARVRFQASRVGSLEHSFDLLFEFSWFIALSWHLWRSSGSGTPLVLAMLIVLFVAFYRHIYDQFRRAMGRSLDDYGRFERVFRRVAGRRNLYNIWILVGILVGVPLYSLLIVLVHAATTAVVYSVRAMKHMYAADVRAI